jgi:hypothetical protein
MPEQNACAPGGRTVLNGPIRLHLAPGAARVGLLVQLVADSPRPAKVQPVFGLVEGPRGPESELARFNPFPIKPLGISPMMLAARRPLV